MCNSKIESQAQDSNSNGINCLTSGHKHASRFAVHSPTLLTLLLVWALVCQTVTPARVQATKGSVANGAVVGDTHWLKAFARAILPSYFNADTTAPHTDTLTDAVISRRAPSLRSGRIEGNLRVLKAEPLAISGASQLTGELFLRGSPSIQLEAGGQHGGMINDGGVSSPNYVVSLAATPPGKVHTHTHPISLPSDFPSSVPASTGLRTITVRSQSDVAAIGDWHTVRDLSITRAGLSIDVPPGNYGTFTVNGNSRLNFTAGTYNFANTFNLDGSGSLQATGQVTINVAQNLTINSGAVVLGSYTSPGDVRLNVLGSALNINGSSQVSALVRAYNGSVALNGTSQVRGQVIANSFILNGGKVIGAVWPAITGTVPTIFGPRRFDRTTGQPNQYLEQFSLPAGITSPFMLRIQNGAADGSNRVSSATVKLNGAEILIQNDLNQSVATIERAVEPGSTNALEVRLTSSPGSYLIINITGTKLPTDTTAPSLSISEPTDNATTTDSLIHVRGTVSDAGTPSSGVAHVYVNEVEASIDVEQQTWLLSNVVLEMGQNELIVRAVDEAGNETTRTITVMREAPNEPPVVNAGPDQTFALPHTASLHGTASDGGLPAGSDLLITWSVVSSVGSVTFTDVNALAANASFESPGTYVLRLTASDGELSSSDEITLTVQPENQPPTVDAGAAQTIALPRTATLNGTVTDDGLPQGSTLSILWSQVNGPGTVTFETPLLNETVASFSEPGTYVLRLTASDGELTASNEVTITVHPENQPPTANAGPDQIISLPGVTQLNGSAADDGWPFGSTLSTTWTQLDGPGTATFSSPHTTVTAVGFSAAGVYVLRLTSSDGDLTTTDDLVVTVTPPNQAPLVSAGPDQTITVPAVANLTGTVSDDSLPLGNSVSFSWAKMSGPGEVAFADPSQPITTVLFNAAGEYVLRLTASDGEMSRSDELTITVVQPGQAPVADFMVPQSSGAAGGFVVASSGSPSSSSAPELILDNNTSTSWTTKAPANQFVTIQFFDQQSVFIDRVRLQSHQGGTGTTTVKDFEVQISSTTSEAPSFHTVLSGTYVNNGRLQEFILPNGPARARFVKFLPKSNHAGVGNIRIGSFNPVAVGSIDSIISLPGQVNAALSQSPALYHNGGVIHSFSYGGGTNSANGLLGYASGGWNSSGTANQFAIVQLAGNQLHSISGVKLATSFESGSGKPTAVKDFEVWVSTTTTDPGAFSRVLTATAEFVGSVQTYLFPGGPFQARYLKYVPLNNHAGGNTIRTEFLDVLNEAGARVVGVSGEYNQAPHGAGSAFDGDPDSVWLSPVSSATNVWIKTALTGDAVHKVFGFRILPVNDFSFGKRGPKDFEVRVSTTTTDDSAFTTIYSGTLAGPFGGDFQEIILNKAVDAKYVQFIWTNGYSTSNIGVREIEVLAVPTDAAAVIGFSSQDDLAGNCIDLDPSNRWTTASGQTTNQWIKLALPGAELANINHVALRPAIAVNTLFGAPKDFELQVSTTDAADTSFTTVLMGTLIDSTQLQDFYFPATAARYVKLLLKNSYPAERIGLATFYLFAANEVGTTVRFFDQSTDADGTIVSWTWDFGDGSTSNQQHPTHTYARPGEYIVSLTVIDNTGLAHTRQYSYRVNDSLHADFSYSSIWAYENGAPVRLTDLTRGMLQPSAVRQFALGNGGTLSQSSTPSSYTYLDSGIFSATLKVGDPLGISHTATKDVNVLNLPPSVDIDPGKTVVWGEQWTSVPKITDQSPVDLLSLHGQWHFGDGHTSACVNCTNANATVTHAYHQPGTYDAVLTVTDKDGGVGSDSATFIVNKRPTAFIFQGPPAQADGPLTVSAQLMDAFANVGLVGKPIQITVNGAAFNAITGANGIAEVHVPLPGGTRIDIIVGSFAGDDFYSSGSGVSVPVTAGATQSNGTPSHEGTDFWLMFPAAYSDGAAFAIQSLFISSRVATTGTITIPGRNFTQPFSVQANGVSAVTLPNIHVHESDQITNKGIHVTAQQPVSVYGLNKRLLTSDAFLGLPVNALGLDHYILTYSNMSFAPSTEFGLVASENNTAVTITPSVTTGNRVAGMPYTITLNQGQTYLLQNETPTTETDLSGSRVSSNKPVAVYAGHKAATIPAEAICCGDHLVEQVPPVNAWGKRFATVPIATRTKGDFFRFIAAENDTAIYLDGNLAYTLAGGQYVERILTARTEIISTKPIMVAQYATSALFDPAGSADPFLMIIPPYTQFLNHYTISTPVSGFSINYANLVAPTASLASISLDGEPLPTAAFIPIGMSGFSGAQIPLSIGAHTFEGPVDFGVFVYGFSRDEGYGYPGGMNMTAPARATNVRIVPETLARSINTDACVTALVTDERENPLGGRSLLFTVTGANPSTSSIQTDAAGHAKLCYAGINVGTDNVTAATGDTVATSSIVWLPPNQAPLANAGPDQTVTLPASVVLPGSATDDGLPSNTLNITWSKVSGPGNATFADVNAVTTSANLDAAGVYVLRLTVDDGELSGADDIQVTVNAAPSNQPPTVDAGPDVSASINANLIVNGGNDFALINNQITGWAEVAGAGWRQSITNDFSPQRGTAYFAAGDPLEAELRQDIDVSSFAAGIEAGTQQFEFTAYLRSAAESVPDSARVLVEYRDAPNTNVLATLDSGPITSTSAWHLTEDVRAAPAGTAWIRVRLLATRNTGQTNDAAFDSVSLRPVANATVKLAGSATDDGVPPGGSFSSTWTVLSGPGPVSFAEANSPATAALFTSAGTYVLRLTSTDGLASVCDDVVVIVYPANQRPSVNAGAGQTITLPAVATLSGSITDDGQPPGSSVLTSWTRMSGPGLVTFTDAHEATTSAVFSGPGTYVLRLSADDGEYGSSAEVTINVNPAANNQPPTVNAGADKKISLPADTVTLNGMAADDGLPVGSNLNVAWTMINGPANVNFGSASAAETTAHFTATGTYVLRLSASDGEFVATDHVTIILTPPNEPPVANAGGDQTSLLSQPVQLNGDANDDGLPGGTFNTNWSQASGPGMVTFDNPHMTVTGARFSATGTYVLRLTANDGEFIDSDEVTITVIDDVPPPTVALSSPHDGSDLTDPTSITGSVSNGNWVLEYSLNTEDGASNQVWTEVSSGVGAVTNNWLGTLDTTLMLNGIYSLRLRATDSYGQTAFTSISVVVDKNFKVGQFQIAFSDLSMPVAGLPIEVVRSYDSRDKRVGDFGVGWQLGIRSARVEKTGVLGFGWHQTATSGFTPTYCLEPSRPHKVAITFADGKVFKFRASTAIHCQQLAPITATRLTFAPEPGTHATLESTTATDVVVAAQGSVPGPVHLLNQSNPDIFNTGSFRLTLAEGTVYLIDQLNGVSSVRDPYGNTLTIGAGGIIHSSGQSISFTRDSAGRITHITDPRGNVQDYNYDTEGDLTSYTDREQNTTTFTYNSDHHLLSITDARGVNLLTNEYDADGRLIGQSDAFSKSITYDHNVIGRIETITDRLGQPTSYEYDERGNVLRQTDARGGVKTFTYDAFDNVLTETNALGKTTTYTYDAADNRTSITDPLNNVTTFTYNAARQPLTVTDARGHVTTNTYDATGTNLLTTTDQSGHTTTFTYSVFTGQRTTMRDALNHLTRYAYDAANRLQGETDPLGNVTTYGYDSNGNRATQTLRRTNAPGVIESITTTYAYDKLNRLTRTSFADGSFTEVEYNAIGQQAATIDQLGHRTEFLYDEMGRLIKATYPDGAHEETTYDAEGRRLTSKDRAGRVTAYFYDELGRLIRTTYPDNTFTTTTYDAAGHVLTTTDARGSVTHSFYDDAGRQTKVRNALDQDTTFTFDANGNQLSISDALGRITTYEYDANNRRTKTTYPDGSLDIAAYDAMGRTVAKTDQAGKTTQFVYDALGRLTRVKDALNQETTYSYNELGQQLSQTDANNHTTRFEYDQLGRRVRRTLPGGQFETFSYDDSGNLKQRTDFNGHTTKFTYDTMRRLLSKIPDALLNQPTVSFTYNSNGRRATMNDASGATVYQYDDRDRLASKQTPFGTVSYTYDDAGNLLTMRSSNANGASVDYSYDSLNRLDSVKDNRLTALNGGITTYNYDAVGNLHSYVYPNGVATTYNYSSLNRLLSMNAATPVTTLASYTYTLGASGNRTAVTELSGRTVNYSYDDLYRLTGENIANEPNGFNGNVTYAYDAVGNRLSRTSSLPGVPSQSATYDANDRLTSDTYDANGNTKVSTGGSYDYDFENRLITHHSALITGFVYDGDGNRVARTVAGVTTNYLVDTNNHTGYAQVVEELQDGAVVKQFTYGHDLISQRCTLPTANCTLSFYQYDGHGSVRQLTDAAASVTDTYDYDAFGNLIYRTGTTSNDYLYSGEQFDSKLGFYYQRARYMNPSSGRFWTMDSYEGSSYDPTSLHKYLYADGNPANRQDPGGQFSVIDTVITSTVIGAISGAGFGYLSGGFKGAIQGAVQGAILGALVPLTGAGVGAFVLGNAARGVFVVGWGVGLGQASVSGYSLATATTGSERFEAGVGLVGSVAFLYLGPKVLQRANTKVISAEEANSKFLAARKGEGQPPWASGTNVTETTIFRPAEYVRVYAEGITKPVGAWVMDASEIKGLSPIQIKQKFALPYTPTHIVPANIPAGTTIKIGTAGANSFGNGGGMQVNIKLP